MESTILIAPHNETLLKLSVLIFQRTAMIKLVAKAKAHKIPPKEPLHVFFGLIFGQSFGPPKVLPMKNAPESVAIVIINI